MYHCALSKLTNLLRRYRVQGVVKSTETNGHVFLWTLVRNDEEKPLVCEKCLAGLDYDEGYCCDTDAGNYLFCPECIKEVRRKLNQWLGVEENEHTGGPE